MPLPKHRPLEEIIRRFKFQSQRDDCWSVCLYNVLLELSERLEEPALHLKEAQLNRAMGYGRGYGALTIRHDTVRPSLNRLLSASSFEIQERTGTTLEGLVGLLGTEEVSYPVAGLSYGYLRAKRSGARLRIDGEPPRNIDHTVVILRAGPTEVLVFDPLDRFGRGGRRGSPDGLVAITTPSFLEYWSQASVDRQWVMFAGPKGKRKVQDLSKYLEGHHADQA